MGYAADLTLRLAILVNLALALAVPFRWGGRLLLCQGVFVGLGAYGVPLLYSSVGLHPLVGVPAAGLAGAFAGLGLAAIARRLDPARFAVVTFLAGLAGLEVYENWASVTGGRTGLAALPASLCASKASVAVLNVVLAGVAAFVYHRAYRGQVGRSLRAVRDDCEGAALDGVSPPSRITEALVLLGFHSALVGAAWQFALPRILPEYFDFWSLSLPVVLACILGGREQPPHMLLGALLVLGLDEGAQWLPVPPEVRADVPPLAVGVVYVLATLAGGADGITRLAAKLTGRLFVTSLHAAPSPDGAETPARMGPGKDGAR